MGARRCLAFVLLLCACLQLAGSVHASPTGRSCSVGAAVSSQPPGLVDWTTGPAFDVGPELLHDGAGAVGAAIALAPAAAFPAVSVAVDVAGRLYVSDASGRVVRVLDQSSGKWEEAQRPAPSGAHARAWEELRADSGSVSVAPRTLHEGAESAAPAEPLRPLPFAAAAAAARDAADGAQERLWVLDSGKVRVITCTPTPTGSHRARRAALQASPSPPLPPPPPDFYVAGLNGLQNLAFDNQVSASSSAAPNPGQAVGYLSDSPLRSDYSGRCGVAAAGSFQTNDGDPVPFYQVDLGGPAAITDVQVWATEGFSDWLSPLSVFVSNTSSVRNGTHAFGTPCYVFTAADTAGTPYSVQHACAGQGRYVTLALLSPLDAHPTSLILRFCALMVFGEYSPPPPPPPPPPAPPQAPPAPNAPFVPFQWWVVLIILIFSTAIAAIVLGSLTRLWVLARAKLALQQKEKQLAKADEKLTEAARSALREAEKDDEYIRTRVNKWPTSPRRKREATQFDNSVFPVLGAELNTLQQSAGGNARVVELSSRHVPDDAWRDVEM